MTTRTRSFLDTPLGRLSIEVEDGALVAIRLPPRPGDAPLPPARDAGSDPVHAAAVRQLVEYFAGERTTFDLPLRPRGTPFQQAVWTTLLAIPAGETRSYVDIARAIGRPSAVRAVGAANGRNPLAIVVPCHRVIGASGALTGYAGGLDAKRWLLAHEAGQRNLLDLDARAANRSNAAPATRFSGPSFVGWK
jgi:methylated-DNA-[protein]-cysteine S-methyltransferase